MSFIMENTGKSYEPGYFLAHEECTRVTKTMSALGAYVQTAANGGKYVPMGTVWPSNDANAVGIVYEDVDVSSGDMPGSVVTAGEVYEDKLPAEVQAAAKAPLAASGIILIAESPSAPTRPY